MLLDIKDFQCTPNIIAPEGEQVSLSFKANSAEPTHLRARYWIADGAPFTFRTGGTSSKEIFFPNRTGKFEAPFTWRKVAEKSTSIEPVGEATQHDEPLKLNLDVLGFTGNQHLGTEEIDIFVTIDTLRQSTLGGTSSALSMALRIVNADVGVSQRRIAEILSTGCGQTVSEGLVSKVIQGGSSDALMRRLRGE